ncbi:zinc ribbon domain-containing protein [Paenibacillus sp. HJGM_3]
MQCSKCKVPVQINWNFCSYCGSALCPLLLF